jgi:hypothetical protein
MKSSTTFLFLTAVFVVVFGAIYWNWRADDRITKSVPLPTGANFAHFDPLAHVEVIRASLGSEVRLLSIQAEGYRLDAAVDLTLKTTPTPKVTYVFFEPGTFGEVPTYGVASGTVLGRRVTVEALNRGTSRSVSYQSGLVKRSFIVRNKGLMISYGGAGNLNKEAFASIPSCSVELLQSVISSQGIDQQEPASFIYDAVRGYQFFFPRLNKQVQINRECQREHL